MKVSALPFLSILAQEDRHYVPCSGDGSVQGFLQPQASPSLLCSPQGLWRIYPQMGSITEGWRKEKMI